MKTIANDIDKFSLKKTINLLLHSTTKIRKSTSIHTAYERSFYWLGHLFIYLVLDKSINKLLRILIENVLR